MVLADSPYLNATSIQDFSGAAVLGQQGTALDDVIEQIEGVDHLSPVGSVPDMLLPPAAAPATPSSSTLRTRRLPRFQPELPPGHLR